MMYGMATVFGYICIGILSAEFVDDRKRSIFIALFLAVWWYLLRH